MKRQRTKTKGLSSKYAKHFFFTIGYKADLLSSK